MVTVSSVIATETEVLRFFSGASFVVVPGDGDPFGIIIITNSVYLWENTCSQNRDAPLFLFTSA